jgi:hypothetical protein
VEKGSVMSLMSLMSSIKASGRFTALAFAATLAFGFSYTLATDAPAGDKPVAAQGVVAEKAIHADGAGDCAKAAADCPKEAKADCCKKGAKGAKGSAHHKHEHKGAEAKAAPAGAAGSNEKPAGKAAEAEKGAPHPG